MKLFSSAKDGGAKSTVTGFWICEFKSLFSIVILRFDKGSREVFHNHAFNAFTWWIRGEVEEHLTDGSVRRWTPSLKPKYTPRSCFHKVYGIKTTYALSIRGPWSKTWQEQDNQGRQVTLGHGRIIKQGGL